MTDENLVKFAAILFNKYRAAAKTGVSCVMASKRLKAIAVRDSRKVEVADPKAVNEVA
ncbi:MAG: hypothetical protein N3H31_00725 [Candidatus Nezhaarchaeota archaeon]|nr:hypothetical protein [Candidatus Nezhaarchaeota archaeon]